MGISAERSVARWLASTRCDADETDRSSWREGSVALTVSGTYGEDSFEATRNLRSAFVGQGDVVADARLTGRRTGDCTPAPEGGNTAAPANTN